MISSKLSDDSRGGEGREREKKPHVEALSYEGVLSLTADLEEKGRRTTGF